MFAPVAGSFVRVARSDSAKSSQCPRERSQLIIELDLRRDWSHATVARIWMESEVAREARTVAASARNRCPNDERNTLDLPAARSCS